MPAVLCAGRLLVAAPALVDPNFARSVVLLLEHDAAGSVGVILNRPSELAVADVLQAWSPLATSPEVVFQGGPVGRDGALAVAALGSRAGRAADAQEPPGWRRVHGGLGLVDLDSEPGVLRPALSSLRIFAGYAGWGGGQLEAELAQEAWFVVDAEHTDAFSPRPEGLWNEVLRRQPGELAFVATCPVDPTLN